MRTFDRRRIATPTAPMPKIIIAQAAGSGTAPTPAVGLDVAGPKAEIVPLPFTRYSPTGPKSGLKNAMYSTSANDLFYFGRGNENAGKTIANWASSLTGATVNGYSVGVESSAGTGYHAFVDNVAFTKGGVTTNYNFETALIPGAVPETASWLMMILGFGLAGVGMRRCVRSSNGEFETKKAYAAI